MLITTHDELENTREKLSLIEDRLRALATEPGDGAEARAWTIRSLRRLANEMKEDMVRFESRVKAGSNPV
jgi:hypothetical protein